MGKIIKISPKIVRPTEDDLCPKRFSRIIFKYTIGEEHNLGIPVVKYYQEEYFTIDGHHRFTAADLYDREIDAYLAEGNTDFIKRRDFPYLSKRSIQDANRCIMIRYFGLEWLADDLENIGISTFYDLRQKFFPGSVDDVVNMLKSINTKI